MCLVAIGDDCAGRLGEFEVARQEVGMEMRFEYPLDAQAEPFRVGDVLRHISLRINDDRAARGLVTEHVAVERQAPEFVLVEDHRRTSAPSQFGLKRA